MAGSPPIGSVLTSKDGTIVGSGRSRRFESDSPTQQLANTNLAHAEMNAMIELPPGRYVEHSLHTTLHPCLLCTAAITHSHIGHVIFAASDPLWDGLDALPELNEHVRRRWPTWEGPAPGTASILSSLLVTIWHLRREPNHPFIVAMRSSSMRIVDTAERIAPHLQTGRESQFQPIMTEAVAELESVGP